MKILLLRILPLFVFVLLFASCEKAEDTALRDLNPQLSAEEYLDQRVEQNVIFQYSEIDEEGRLKSGWVIDKTGQVRSFSFGDRSWGSEGKSCSLDDMQNLEDALTVELGEVDLEELVSNYRRIFAASEANLEADFDSKEASSAFFAYRLRGHNQYQTDDHDCSDSDNDRAQSGPFASPYYDQILLIQEGSKTIRNGSSKAREIVQWLQEVQTEFGR